MNYIIWALVAMLGYTLVAPLMKVALVEVPSTVAVLVSNTILVTAAVAVVAVTESDPLTHLSNPKMLYVVAAGLCLAVGILAYYRALELGPISVVVPIFAMFIVTSSVVGILFLEEVLTLRKGLGIVLGMAAVYLSATG
ncbi:multidrug transporter [Halobacteriales archaeon QH_8_68_33]|nr:MAG: multidrug transporter [Halobacteriales archaeon QH_1_68_42]PSP93200.1 MAG: multidrug transporter [Halobacteriales archaeon QH_8_68_33]